MASHSWHPILEEIQAYLLAYEVDSVNIFDDNVYLGGVIGNPVNPFIVLDWAPDGSKNTNWPQNSLMVDTDEVTTIYLYYTVENGDGTNAITQELQKRVYEAQKEVETALNKWIYDKLPVEIDPVNDPGVFTDWSKKIYNCKVMAKPITIQFTNDAPISTAVRFTMELKYNDNNAI